MTLPIALERQDIIGQAKTGTGKTLGFGLPALEHVIGPNDKGFNDLPAPGAPQALIVTPTRELAVQVCKDLEAAAAKLSARIRSEERRVGKERTRRWVPERDKGSSRAEVSVQVGSE